VKVEFARTFTQDLKRIRDTTVLKRVQEVIDRVERLSSPTEIPNLKKLRGLGNYSRIRVGDYRIGIALKDERVIFVRFLNRKDMYKYFP